MLWYICKISNTMKTKKIRKEIEAHLEQKIQEAVLSINKEAGAKIIKSVKNAAQKVSKKLVKSMKDEVKKISTDHPSKPANNKPKAALKSDQTKSTTAKK